MGNKDLVNLVKTCALIYIGCADYEFVLRIVHVCQDLVQFELNAFISVSLRPWVRYQSIIYIYIYIYIYICCILTFWPGQKCHSKMIHRKEVTHSNGSYERKLRGRKWADEMGRAKKFPWYTHRLMHWKRVTSELHDSYFRWMTIKHSISKIEWAIE